MYKSRKKSAVLCAGIFLALRMWMLLSVYCWAAEANHVEKQSQMAGQEKVAEQKLIRIGSFEDTFNYIDENGVRRGFGLCRLWQAIPDGNLSM